MSLNQHFNYPFIVKSNHFILCITCQANFDDIFALRADPDVMRYVGDGNIQTKNQVQEHIDLAKPYYDKYGLGFFSVFSKKTGDFIGQAGLFHLGFDINNSEIELAYRYRKKYWGKGYATEIAKALIEWGFSQHNLPKIVAVTYRENLASQRVLEKCGMHYIKDIYYRGVTVPCYEIKK